jgi:hypothetical protein
VLKYKEIIWYSMSWIIEKLVHWWEGIKYPEDKEKEQRINEIIDEMKKKQSISEPKRARIIKS